MGICLRFAPVVYFYTLAFAKPFASTSFLKFLYLTPATRGYFYLVISMVFLFILSVFCYNTVAVKQIVSLLFLLSLSPSFAGDKGYHGKYVNKAKTIQANKCGLQDASAQLAVVRKAKWINQNKQTKY